MRVATETRPVCTRSPTTSREYGGTVCSESLFPTNPVDDPGRGTRIVPRPANSHEQHYREPLSHEQHYREPLSHEQHYREPLSHEQHYREPLSHEQHYRERTK
jgi:hypothetical protein